jgi:hypothetical protein
MGWRKKMNNEKYMITLDNWYNNYALEIELVDDNSFLLAVETLERIGILANNKKTLFQSCHILFKRDKYYIVHFKELFALDGRFVNLTEDDIKRRNLIASLLEDWGMIKIVNKDIRKNVLPISAIKIIKHFEKENYDLVAKYQIGNKHK